MTEPGYLGGALSNHQIKKQFFQTTWLDVPLYYSLLFSAILQFSAILFYSILFYSSLVYSILFYSIILYSTLLCYSTLLYHSLLFSSLLFSTLLYTPLFATILYYSLLYSSLLLLLLYYSLRLLYHPMTCEGLPPAPSIEVLGATSGSCPHKMSLAEVTVKRTNKVQRLSY